MIEVSKYAPVQKRVLVTVHTMLTFKYISRYLDILRPDTRLALYATQGEDMYSTGVSDAMSQLGIPIIPFNEAIQQPWDMVLFATHGGAVLFHKAASKIHIQHGIGAGKLVNNDDFTYGRQWALWEGIPKYNIMLESSYSTMRRAIQAVPELAGHIAVVGDLFCDDVLAGIQHREKFRAQLGIDPFQTAVLFMSTWGEHGLLRSRGTELLDAAQKLPSKYKIVLTMHNHLWAGRTGEPSSWPARLSKLPKERFVICGPMDSWVPYIVAADVAVLDHGSLGMYYALTRKPAITIHVPEHVVTPDAPSKYLRSQYPLLSRVTELPDIIEHAQQTYNAQTTERIIPQITSFPGHATECTRFVLYQQLRLSPLYTHSH